LPQFYQNFVANFVEQRVQGLALRSSGAAALFTVYRRIAVDV
jgi:hypothetical protein